MCLVVCMFVLCVWLYVCMYVCLYQVKLQLYHHHLEHEMTEAEHDDDLVVAIDAYDVLIFPTLASRAHEIFERYIHTYIHAYIHTNINIFIHT